jgi:hypothetical protein
MVDLLVTKILSKMPSDDYRKKSNLMLILEIALYFFIVACIILVFLI